MSSSHTSTTLTRSHGWGYLNVTPKWSHLGVDNGNISSDVWELSTEKTLATQRSKGSLNLRSEVGLSHGVLHVLLGKFFQETRALSSPHSVSCLSPDLRPFHIADEECRLLLQLCDRRFHYLYQPEAKKQLSWQPYWDAGYGRDVQPTCGGLSVWHRYVGALISSSCPLPMPGLD